MQPIWERGKKSKLVNNVEKEVREMGYESCDEEWSPLKWYLLLECVQERKSLDSERVWKSEAKK